MTKFPEVEKRMYRGVFVCRKCKSKARAQPLKVLAGKVTCKKCGRSVFRPIKKK